MGWDEKVFGTLYKLLRPRRGPAHGDGAVHLDELRGRLRVLGIAIAERPLEVSEAEAAGGIRGATLLLPQTIDLRGDRSDNELAYVVHVALGATIHRLGLHPPRLLERSAAELVGVLAVVRALVALDDELPRLRAQLSHLAPYVIAERKALRCTSPADAALETLVRRTLGASGADADFAGAGPAARAWAEDAEALARTCSDGGSLARAAERLAGSLTGGHLHPVCVWGALHPQPPVATSDDVHSNPGEHNSTGTERKGKIRENVRRVSMSENTEDENPLTHSFEKVHTAEEYVGGKKHISGDDEMAEHGEALDELDMHETVRTKQAARSLYRAEVSFEGDVGELDGGFAPTEGIAYDEWDESARKYRREHCRVVVSRGKEAENKGAVHAAVRTLLAQRRRQVRELEARFSHIERARAWRFRQPDGAEIDIDALIDRYASLAAGNTGPDNLHMAKRPQAPTVAILVLLDASLSTDAWVAGRRVLDVAKESLVVLGAALESLSIDTGVAAFFSNTRRDCRYVELKSFDEDFRAAHPRLARLAPAGYTRIGPALRHATVVLESVKARRKLVLLLSDGKPTDFDRYEGRYGMGDIRQAVREAERTGVRVAALALDPSARRYLPQMFGASGFEVLATADDLVRAIGAICLQLSA